MSSWITETWLYGMIPSGVAWLALFIWSLIEWGESYSVDQAQNARRLLRTMSGFFLIPIWPIAITFAGPLGFAFAVRKFWGWISHLREVARSA